MLLSWDSTKLTREVLDQVVPPPHDELSLAVIGCIAKGDAGGALAALDAALQTGRTVDRFCDHLIEHVRTLMLLRVCGADTELVDVASSDRPALLAQAERFDAPTFVYMIALLEELRRNVKFSGAARALADAAVVRLSMSGQFTDIADLLNRLDGGAGGAAAPSHAAPPASDAGTKKKAGDGGAVAQPVAKPVAVNSHQGRTGVGEPSVAGDRSGTAPAAPSRPRVSPAELQKIASDPFIQRVKEAVGGMVVDVRPARAIPAPDAVPEPQEVSMAQETSPLAEP
jgi:DNA polymerase III gamma/tau subunit